MSVDATLTALVQAYIQGNRVARMALLDWLTEQGDPRVEAVRAGRIDWHAVACDIYRRRERLAWDPAGMRDRYHRAEIQRCRWWIDCALVGSSVPPDVADAVRQTHRKWLLELFPEAK